MKTPGGTFIKNAKDPDDANSAVSMSVNKVMQKTLTLQTAQITAMTILYVFYTEVFIQKGEHRCSL